MPASIKLHSLPYALCRWHAVVLVMPVSRCTLLMPVSYKTIHTIESLQQVRWRDWGHAACG